MHGVRKLGSMSDATQGLLISYGTLGVQEMVTIETIKTIVQHFSFE